MTSNQQPSSEPSWVTIADGSDRDWRLISMYELKKLEHAINEDEPGHLKELHDSGNEAIDKVRIRVYPWIFSNDINFILDVDTIGVLLNIVEKDCDRLTVLERQAYRRAKSYERELRDQEIQDDQPEQGNREHE
jgi:hypothetical protein